MGPWTMHYKNHTTEYLCSEHMFSSTFQWKQTIEIITIFM
jgi:hypothetical protein